MSKVEDEIKRNQILREILYGKPMLFREVVECLDRLRSRYGIDKPIPTQSSSDKPAKPSMTQKPDCIMFVGKEAMSKKNKQKLNFNKDRYPLSKEELLGKLIVMLENTVITSLDQVISLESRGMNCNWEDSVITIRTVKRV